MPHKRSFYFDANGNKADWNFLVEAEFDSSCEITITAICVWCDVEGYKDWIDQTKEIEARETLYSTLYKATEQAIIDSEIDYAMNLAELQAEAYTERSTDAYLDSKL